MSSIGTGARLSTKLKRELGPVLSGALADPATIECMVNPSGQLWVERAGQPPSIVGTLPSAQVHAIIATVAATLNRVANAANPILEGELPTDGSRFEGLLPPIVSRPTFTIRRRASQVYSLNDYVDQGVIDADQRVSIRDLIARRKNILICGGTGSGKTTLTNALIDEIVQVTPSDRLIIIEDTFELQCAAQNHVTLHTSDNVTMDQLLRATLRMRPDRILVGEVRGPEALALLKAWNTGHPGGVATLHANSPRGALTRLEQLAGESSSSTRYLPALIAETVDVIVFIQRTSVGRIVQEIVSVEAVGDGDYPNNANNQ